MKFPLPQKRTMSHANAKGRKNSAYGHLERRKVCGAKMKTKLLATIVLILGCFVAAAEEKEIIKDKSPDGKFAVRVKETDSGRSAQVIELSTKRAVIDLGETGNAEEVNLVWSVDSRHAAFSNGNTGVSGVYFRDGDQFREVALPNYPTCGEAKDQDPKNLSTVYLHP